MGPYEGRRVIVCQSSSIRGPQHLHNGAGALGGIATLEDAGANEDAVHAHLHHERRIRWGRHAACEATTLYEIPGNRSGEGIRNT